MPSFHAGWSVLLGIVVFRASNRWPLRAFAVLVPAAMVVAVVVTANHFVLDVFAGTAIVLATLLVVEHRNRARETPTLAAHDGRTDDRIASRAQPPQNTGPFVIAHRAGNDLERRDGRSGSASQSSRLTCTCTRAGSRFATSRRSVQCRCCGTAGRSHRRGRPGCGSIGF